MVPKKKTVEFNQKDEHGQKDSKCANDRARELRLVFESFDVDGDGNLSKEEVKANLTGMGLNVDMDQIEAMIDECDKDGDG
jgi:Ca2+-binding EF-hand superfamily protein